MGRHVDAPPATAAGTAAVSVAAVAGNAAAATRTASAPVAAAPTLLAQSAAPAGGNSQTGSAQTAPPNALATPIVTPETAPLAREPMPGAPLTLDSTPPATRLVPAAAAAPPAPATPLAPAASLAPVVSPVEPAARTNAPPAATAAPVVPGAAPVSEAAPAARGAPGVTPGVTPGGADAAAAPEVPAPPAGRSAEVDPRVDTGPIARPPVQSGDEWIYRRFTGKRSVLMRQSALRVSPEGIALRTELAGSPDTSTALYDRSWGLVASGYNDYQPALAYYSFPLYAGKRWSINSAVSNFGAGQSGRIKGVAWATGWEQVEVAAGKFLALKIEIDIETGDPGDATRTMRVRETHWYARTVLRAVKVESHAAVADQEPTAEVIELVSYKMD